MTDLHNLSWAYWKAARGRRDQPEVRRFENHLDRELRSLQGDVRTEALALGSFRRFVIHDPKRRVIHAPSFRERVLQHALMRPIEPVLDRSLVDGTFACRRGKGVLSAVEATQHNLRRFPWLVKIDMRAYFDSVDHEVLLRQVERRIKGKPVLRLLRRIVTGYEASSGRGLPIGALTSQHMANLYLSPLDRTLLEELRVPSMVRYMDDVVWWCRTRRECKDTLRQARDFAEARLGLEIKPSVQIRRSADGVTFCGFRIRKGIRLLSRRRCRRFREACVFWEDSYTHGRIDARQLQRGMATAIAGTRHADASEFRRQVLRSRPGLEA